MIPVKRCALLLWYSHSTQTISMAQKSSIFIYLFRNTLKFNTKIHWIAIIENCVSKIWQHTIIRFAWVRAVSVIHMYVIIQMSSIQSNVNAFEITLHHRVIRTGAKVRIIFSTDFADNRNEGNRFKRKNDNNNNIEFMNSWKNRLCISFACFCVQAKLNWFNFLKGKTFFALNIQEPRKI